MRSSPLFRRAGSASNAARIVAAVTIASLLTSSNLGCSYWSKVYPFERESAEYEGHVVRVTNKDWTVTVFRVVEGKYPRFRGTALREREIRDWDLQDAREVEIYRKSYAWIPFVVALGVAFITGVILLLRYVASRQTWSGAFPNG